MQNSAPNSKKCSKGAQRNRERPSHHVGDWEKVYVRFQKVNADYQIYSIYLSMHNSAITKTFGGEFLWQSGQFKKGDKTLAMFESTHAIIYSAAGSHGMWPDTGRHEYLKLSNGYALVDQTSSGTSWYTWEYLKPVQYDPSGQYSGDFKFLGYQGHRGDKKQQCGFFNNIKELFGECQLNNGPKGPSGFIEPLELLE